MDISRQGQVFATINPLLSGKAPDFSLLDGRGQQVTLSDFDKPVIVSVFPDINTRVCSLQTRRFNQEVASHPGLGFLSISNNTPEEQANWCASEGVDMTVLSDQALEFGKAYGLVMEEVGLLARAVYVIHQGEIIYAQVLAEITDEPDYDQSISRALSAI